MGREGERTGGALRGKVYLPARLDMIHVPSGVKVYAAPAGSFPSPLSTDLIRKCHVTVASSGLVCLSKHGVIAAQVVSGTLCFVKIKKKNEQYAEYN